MEFFASIVNFTADHHNFVGTQDKLNDWLRWLSGERVYRVCIRNNINREQILFEGLADDARPVLDNICKT